MTFRTEIVVVSFLLACLSAYGADSYCTGDGPCPDVGLWTDVFNPDGSQAVPVVAYDPATGLLFIDTRGCNQIVDTVGGSEIGVDDVGMISLSIESPQYEEAFLEGFVPSQFGGGVAWQSQYFAAKSQVFGVGAGTEYLDPSDRTDLFRFAPGLEFVDFGTVEIAVNFESGVPGNTIFGLVQIVPEPDSLLLALICLGMVFLAKRRR